jgi:hypothetical protein
VSERLQPPRQGADQAFGSAPTSRRWRSDHPGAARESHVPTTRRVPMELHCRPAAAPTVDCRKPGTSLGSSAVDRVLARRDGGSSSETVLSRDRVVPESSRLADPWLASEGSSSIADANRTRVRHHRAPCATSSFDPPESKAEARPTSLASEVLRTRRSHLNRPRRPRPS